MIADLTAESPSILETPAQTADTFVFPASFAQQRLWFLDRLEPDSSAYNIPLSLRFEGNLNVPALESALNELVRRHEILRTTFAVEHSEPVQVVHSFTPFALPVTDLSAQPEEILSGSIRSRVANSSLRPFDLERGPLLRAELLLLSESHSILVMTIHHIVFDGWSSDIFFQELASLYQAFVRQLPSPLSPLPIQYADYAVWQREWLQGAALEQELSYWRTQLADAPPLLELPSDHPRPPTQSYRGDRAPLTISSKTIAALESLSRKLGASLFMTLLAAFQVLLYRNSGQSDVLVGAPIANRNRHEIEGLIGFFVNTLVLRSKLSDDISFADLVSQVRQTALDAYAHQDLPFEKLVEALQPARTLAYAPLVQVAMNYLQSSAPAFQLGDVRAERVFGENNTTKFDLMLNLTRTVGELRGNLEYSTDLFERPTISRLLSQFQVLLDGIALAPDTPLGKLPLLTQSEREQILIRWNQTNVEYPRTSLGALFESQVVRTPDPLAFISTSTRLTFRDLNARANQLAHHLQSLGVRSESPVGVLLERSPEFIISLLAVLKAGGAYLPLDPKLPPARLHHILNDSVPPVIITLTGHLDSLGGNTSHIICLDRDELTISRASSENLDVQVDPDSLAYILYTSGSTGEPKGVMGLHRGLVNRLAWMWRTHPFASNEICCQKTSQNFVDSLAEILGPLLEGVPLLLVSDETVRDPHLLVETLSAHHVTRITLVPSLLRALLSSTVEFTRLSSLKLWVSSGETLDAALARSFYEKLPDATLINLYGSTEVSADATYFHVPKDWQSPRLPIGQPIANTQVYILDASMQPVPIGVTSNLCIGGAGLARGYLNQPDLTSEKFVVPAHLQSPVSPSRSLSLSSSPLILHLKRSESSIRLFQTGDRARFLPDGKIEYMGRADRQVKIHGMRVELGEIEASIRAHPQVTDAAVAVHTISPENTRLVAYLVPKPSHALVLDDLEDFLRDRLPAHMIPSTFVLLDQLPYNSSGKLDWRALPLPVQISVRDAAQAIAPRDEIEAKLQTIWQRVLQVNSIGVTDDFFELGGHSLRAIILFTEIERAFGIKLPVATLFQAPTIEKLARALQGTPSSEWSPLVPIQPHGTKPPFFCVHGFGGGVVGYGQLARLLGDDRPFYGLQALGQTDDVEPDSTIEMMAKHYAAAIRLQQPKGPYYLGGYCYGGTVALEVAQQLVAQGESVRFLGMFENPAPKSGYRSFKLNLQSARRFARNLPHWAADYAALDWKHRWQRVERELKQRAYYGRLRLLPGMRGTRQMDLRDIVEDVAPLPLQHRRVIQVHIAAMIRYVPQPYAGCVTVFRTRRQPLFCSHDPFLNWQELAAQVQVRLVAGSHHNLLEPPYVESLARELAACLDAAQQQS